MKHYIQAGLAICSAALLATSAYAGDMDIDTSSEEVATPMMDMPSEAEMQKMMELTSPGKHHKVLDKMAGEWTYTMSYKMSADAPEQITKGTSSNQWIMGGRYMQQQVEGPVDMGGQTMQFNGMGLMGYNNMKKVYENLWIDNMNTAMMTSTATYNPQSKILTEQGTFSCPMKGENVKFKGTLQFMGDNTMLYTMYDETGAKPYKSMEIKYTRK